MTWYSDNPTTDDGITWYDADHDSPPPPSGPFAPLLGLGLLAGRGNRRKKGVLTHPLQTVRHFKSGSRLQAPRHFEIGMQIVFVALKLRKRPD